MGDNSTSTPDAIGAEHYNATHNATVDYLNALMRDLGTYNVSEAELSESSVQNFADSFGSLGLTSIIGEGDRSRATPAAALSQKEEEESSETNQRTH